MRINGQGYARVYIPTHHRSHADGYVLEHIVVAEKMLGRHLVEGEVVHHKDRNKRNNSPDNLQVMTRADHNKLHMIEDKGKRKTRSTQQQMNKTSSKLPSGYYFLKGVGFKSNIERNKEK